MVLPNCQKELRLHYYPFDFRSPCNASKTIGINKNKSFGLWFFRLYTLKNRRSGSGKDANMFFAMGNAKWKMVNSVICHVEF